MLSMANKENAGTDKAAATVPAAAAKAVKTRKPARPRKAAPYMQNRELSWLAFNERVLDQGAERSVPLFERLQFVSIFSSNLHEFFMVRVGSLTDLSIVNKHIRDTKSNMTPQQQLDAIYGRCHELYPIQERIFDQVEAKLAKGGVVRHTASTLTDEQRTALDDYMENDVLPYLSPQVVNARHPFPHLEDGAIYIVVRLIETKPTKDMTPAEQKARREARRLAKELGADGTMLGIIPLPRQAQRVIELPGKGFNYILLEDALEAHAVQVFSMYQVKHTNIICVTRNADIDVNEGSDESDDDYRAYMKKILKKRARLLPVRLESKRPLSPVVGEFLLKRLDLQEHQVFVTGVPFDMGYSFGLPSMVDERTRAKFTSAPFSPAWPAALDRKQSIIEQVQKRDVLLSYPYESMDAFVKLLEEAAVDPDVTSIKITLYRLASQSRLAEALIRAAENGKEVLALFELRARFDESNNIEWSQRFEEAGAKIIYGFADCKVHSKICCITRRTKDGLHYITQLGTGNYNEKTARLYTDFSYITSNKAIGKDATEFFRNMNLENISRSYKHLWVAPLQVKENVLAAIDEQIALAREGKPCGLFFKTNSVTDKDTIEKIAEACRAGVPTTMLVRGISCIVPGVKGHTENLRVVSIVGRLLEHSRIFMFGPRENCTVYLSSADLMTRNLEKRIEIAWPVEDEEAKRQVLDYVDTCLADTCKLRELKRTGRYTRPAALVRSKNAPAPFNAQEALIEQAAKASAAAERAAKAKKRRK